MQKKDNQRKPYRIYLKATREWVEVSEEVYKEHTRFHDAFRKRHQSHGQCVCPKNKFWLCDADCLTCEFRRAGDHLSLDYTTENEDGDMCSPLDVLADTAPSIEDVICDKAELDQLFARLNELMPEAQDDRLLEPRVKEAPHHWLVSGMRGFRRFTSWAYILHCTFLRRHHL